MVSKCMNTAEVWFMQAPSGCRKATTMRYVVGSSSSRHGCRTGLGNIDVQMHYLSSRHDKQGSSRRKGCTPCEDVRDRVWLDMGGRGSPLKHIIQSSERLSRW
jgi:hypothetical protein